MSLVSIPRTEKLIDTFEDIFTDEFMQTYTRFENFRHFRYSSAVFVSWDQAELIYDEDHMDGFVKESTDFFSWDEMVRTAADVRYGKNPGSDTNEGSQGS